MYQFGFRLGECLGLANVDITERKANGRMYPVAMFRNRMSDNKKFQRSTSIHLKEWRMPFRL